MRRFSSRVMSASALNTAQMQRTRTNLHDRLALRSVDFMERGKGDMGLFMIEGLTQQHYPLVAVDVPSNMLRREMQRVATHEILPTIQDVQTAGVLFYTRSDPRLYGILAANRNGRWHARRSVELPRSMPEFSRPVKQEDVNPEEDTRTGISSLLDVLVTD